MKKLVLHICETQSEISDIINGSGCNGEIAAVVEDGKVRLEWFWDDSQGWRPFLYDDENLGQELESILHFKQCW